MTIPNVVLDTNVLVAASRSRLGASFALLQALRQGRYKALVSVPLMLEYEAVLVRPEHRLATGMSEGDVAEFPAALASAAEPVDVHFMWRPQLSDPADELILEAAVNGQAEAIVTHNARDFHPAFRIFGIPVTSPAQVLKELSK